MTTWKAVELKIASLLGGKRIPVSGRARGDSPDIAHDFFSVEVKHRESLPEWIADAMNQAKESDKDGGKYPLVILHEKNQKFTESYAVLSLGDLIKIKAQLDEAEEYRINNPIYT